MRIGALLRRIEAAAGRFNRWFGPGAVAANAEQSGRVINAMDVSALMGELKEPSASRERTNRV